MSLNKDITSCMGYQQFTAGTSTGLTVPTIDPSTGLSALPTMAMIIVENQAVRFRDDGTAPTSSVGMPISVGTVFFYDGDLKKIRFIQQAATAIINVLYYK